MNFRAASRRVRVRVTRALLAAVPILCAATALNAQRLVGEVVRSDSVTPAQRTLVEWRDARGGLHRASTDDAGRFAIVLRRPDTLSLRVLRPGFRPQELPPLALDAGAERRLRIVLVDDAVVLQPRRVQERLICGGSGEGAAWLIWEQARVALQNVVLSELDTTMNLLAVEYDADVDAEGRVAVRDSSIRLRHTPRRPPAAYYDSLYRDGFVRRVGDTTTYHTPSLGVLADERFAQRYCFRQLADDVVREDWVALGFEPARRPGPGIADLRGAIVLDRVTLHLREVRFQYLNVPIRHRIDSLGGTLRFTELSSGHWLMTDWFVRLPRLSISPRNPVAIGWWGQGMAVVAVDRRGRRLYFDATADSLRARAPQQR